jgi:cell wall-associated NlpC family hydrolase
MRSPTGRLGRGLVVAVVVCVGTVLSSVVPAGAQSADDKRAEARQIAERLAELQQEQMELGATYERANYERHLADQKVAEAEAEAEKTRVELDRRREELRRFAVTAYQGGTELPAAAALQSDEATTGTVKRFYVETTTGDRADLIDALKSAERAAEADIERVNEARAETEARLAEIEQARNAAAKATAAQNELNERVQGELATLVAEEVAARAARNPVVVPVAAGAGTPAPAAPAPAPAPRPAPRVNAPAPAPPPSAPAPPPPSGSKASGAIAAALSKVGSGYVWGAAGPNVFDCSGLVLWAYAQVGVSLPHYSGAQYSMTTRISAAQLQPGDLVFWGPGGSEHVALYMGGNQLVHAFSSAGRTQVTALAGWWKPPSGYGRLNY